MMSSDPEETMLWKEEPLSPNGTSPSDSGEEWLFFDEEPIAFEYNDEKFTLYNQQLSRAEVVTKFLEELDSRKDESYPVSWLEEKIEDLPIFDGIPAPECGQNRPSQLYPPISKPLHSQLCLQPDSYVIAVGHQPQTPPPLTQHQHQHQQQQQQQQQQIVDPTQFLLREFESVLGDVEACHQIGVVPTLTPPQSPSSKVQQQLLITLQPLGQIQPVAFFYDQAQHEQSVTDSIGAAKSIRATASSNERPYAPSSQLADQWSAENLSLDPLVPQSNDNDDDQVAQELAKVDEYLRHCAEDACGSSSSSSNNSASSIASSSSAPASPCASSNASCTSSEDSSADDPDWSFETTGRTTTPIRERSSKASRRANNSKPYSRPNVEDKRSRKKEQNKNAATRYRQKKKQEHKLILGEELGLAEKNEKLHGQVKDLQREIGYLKNLMRDLFKAKGLLK